MADLFGSTKHQIGEEPPRKGECCAFPACYSPAVVVRIEAFQVTPRSTRGKAQWRIIRRALCEKHKGK